MNNVAKTKGKNSISANGELLLYGEIGDYWDGLDALSIVRQLEQLDPNNIAVRIHSAGGLIMEGLAIYNRLKESSAFVTIYIDGLAASMASVVAMAGDRVVMPENAIMMPHKPWNEVIGNADDMREMATSLDQFENSIISIYSAKTGLSSDQLSSILRESKLLSAQECLDFGFVDEISEPIQAAASIDLENFDKATKGKLDGLFSYAAAVAPKPQEDKTMPEALKKDVATDKKVVEETKEHEKVSTAENKADPIDAQAVANAAITAERKRAADIRTIGAQASLTDEIINEMIDSGLSVDAARTKALDSVASRDAEFKPKSYVRVDTDTGAIREAMGNALEHRANPSIIKLSDAGRDFRGMNLMDMAKAMITSEGGSIRGLTPMQIAAKAMHSTSDFPLILADVANKTLRQGYDAAPRTFQPFTRQTSASDFKNINRAQLGEAPELEKVNENGEFKYGTLGEGNESYKIATYGKIISLTRQTLINDDLDAFSRIPMAFGVSASELESSTVWGLITANGAMSDGVALFHNTHKNLGTAGALSETTLSEARKKLRKQQGINTTRPMNLIGEYLIVPAALETAAQKILATINPDASGNVNVFQNSMTLIVEPRLDASSETAWYISAGPSRIDTIEYSYLTGEDGVYIETEQGFDVDGVKIKARLDFGAGVIDFRGLFKNAGA